MLQHGWMNLESMLGEGNQSQAIYVKGSIYMKCQNGQIYRHRNISGYLEQGKRGIGREDGE